jgi:transcriptional regulator with XRE-family HTH domain
MHSFGARLRSQRETQGVALDEISRQTKIKVSLLEALERDDLSHWPHGLFGRAYLRAYAKAVRVDPEPLMREFVELHPDPPDEFLSAEAAASAGISSTIRSAVRSIPGLRRRSEKSAVAATTPVERRAAAAAPSLAMLADVCARLQQADSHDDLTSILGASAQLLDASGLVLWLWDSTACALKPWLSHGYSAHVVAQLPPVRRDDDNAIAAAFRSMQACTVAKGDYDTGALVVPLVTSRQCIGTLSLELRTDVERHEFVGHAALIIAALLASSHLATFTPLISSQRQNDVSAMPGAIRSAIA